MHAFSANNVVAISALFVCVCLSACSLTYVDKRGDTHVIGFVSMVVPGDSAEVSEKAKAVRVSSIGASLFMSSIYSGIALGYSSDEVLVLGDRACIVLNGKLAQSTSKARDAIDTSEEVVHE